MSAESPANLKFEIGHVLFVDIIGYSKLLITEQSELLRRLTEIVRETEQFRIAEAGGKLIRLPTGDGMALVFRNSPEAPVQCALELSKRLKAHPDLGVRMGVHSGPVNEVADVNERTNIAGAGINMAQRVMDCGDAGHILLSKRVADDLEQYPQWRACLHDLGECEVKHGVMLSVVNLYTDEIGNSQTPRKFTSKKANEKLECKSALTPSGKRSLLLAALLVFVAIAALSFFLFQKSRMTGPNRAGNSPGPSERSIAVLPFSDLSPAKNQEYFCDGISEELLDGLAKVPGLRVVARTSSFSFKGINTGVSEIGEKLGVATVLEGSLRREGNRIRVTAQLINTKDGFHLWSDTFERELQSVFAVQDEITRAIVEALKIQLGAAPAPRPQLNNEAYDLYLQGVFFSNKSSEEALRTSLDLFQRSLEKDPNSARAWAGIAKAWEWLADAYVKPLEAYPAMKVAALKAIALDERNSEAHAYLGEAIRVLDWNSIKAEAEVKRALQIDPNSGIAHLFLALSEISQGRIQEGDTQRLAAVQADPLSPIASNFSAAMLTSMGRIDEAITEAKRTQQLDPSYLYGGSMLAEAYLAKGMFSEASGLFKKAQEVSGAPQSGLAVTYAQMGRPDEARQILEQLKNVAATTYLAADEIAVVYAALGENDEAFKWLERAYDEHSGSLPSIAVRPAFRSLRSDPRFAPLLQRMGLDLAKVLPRENK